MKIIKGKPLIHINIGLGRKASGIISIGFLSEGIILSIAKISFGIFSIGAIELGVYSLGVISIGLFSVGALSAGIFLLIYLNILSKTNLKDWFFI